MREFGVRRYGDTLYHHCMADSAADAANWFAHFQTGIAGKDFQDWIGQSGVLGFWEVIKHYGYFRKEFHAALREIDSNKPNAVVLID